MYVCLPNFFFAFLCKYSDRGDGQDGSEEDFMESNICPPLTPRTPQPKPERRKQKRIETTKANQCFPPLTPRTPQAKPKRQKENHKKNTKRTIKKYLSTSDTSQLIPDRQSKNR